MIPKSYGNKSHGNKGYDKSYDKEKKAKAYVADAEEDQEEPDNVEDYDPWKDLGYFDPD